MQSLDGIKSGVYIVYTETSSYVLNFNRMIAKRLPGTGLGSEPKADGAAVLLPMRGDNDWFGIVSVYAVVGQPMHLECTGIAEDALYTWRKTTLIRKIEKVDGRRKV